ncbi:hypothetical protein EST38_g4975 [Candolleomyces aberdarensis]|uniref:J domain-containing protein n=1 Tax=Candolleomyces aberdarensis TaxID=2316362 RepID=A0A4Q2DP13_9AGAR|nr:hypothetical protein EST38_g4975 [Candolleomyces aberdarensis]
MDDNDPISQFFPDDEDVDLYAVLNLTREATSEDIKKSYRRLALMYHPDKHTASSEQAKADASTKFQQVGFAYAVLSDEKRKTRYDKLGKTDEGFELAAGEDGWEAYFEDLFDRLTRGKLDELKKEYQGSQEEVDDLKKAYLETGGSIGEIMTHIPHSTNDDEARFVIIISSLISKKELKSTRTWVKSVKDEKAKLARKKEGEKEAQEAEELAKDLGVWDEFYGSGKATERKKGKGKAADNSADAEGDVSALQALILKKRQKNADDLIDSLAAKYAPKAKGKGKKRAREDDVEEELSSKKKSRAVTPPELDDEEFAKIQERLFGDKAKKAGGEEPKAKKSRARRK